MTQSRNVVSAALVVIINGRTIGEVTSFSFASMTPHEPVMGVDQLEAFELTPGAVKVTGNVGAVRRQGTGGFQGRGIVAPLAVITMQKFFSILIVNRRDQSVFFRADYCKIQQEQWEAAAKGVVHGSFVFEAITWSNEVEVAAV